MGSGFFIVTIKGIMKRTLLLLLVTATALHAEDYAFTARSTSLTGSVSGYDNVTAHAISASFGGAVGAIKANNEFSISNNGNVTLTGCSTTNKGGLFYLNQSSYTTPQLHTTLNISGNTGSVSISNNYSKSYGGAIAADNNGSYPEYYPIINISGNTGSVSFSGNNTDGSGGAIRSDGKLNICNNGNVSFTSNAVNKSNGNWGGAIYMGVSTENTLNISGNDSVVFRGNYLYKPQSTYVPEATVRLNSIYQKGTNQANYISAKTGGSVVFYDAILTESAGSSASYELNADYTDANGATQKAGGTITFSGKHVQQDLASFTDAVGDVTGSLTSTLVANTTLHNGTLSIEDNAVLQAKNLTINGGAQLTLMDGTCEMLTGGSLLFKEGSSIFAENSNTLAAQDITFEENTTLTLALGEANQEHALINLSASNVSFTLGTINFVGVDSLAEGKYQIFALTGSQPGSMNWDTSGLTVEGLSGNDSFEWSEGGTVLYLNHKAIPEPTTATLSLLALTGLAARRRRRK